MMLLRIFFGEKYQDVALDPAKRFAIGRKPKNGFAVDGADLADEHIVFKPEKNSWSVACGGDVWCGEQRYNRKNPYPGAVEPYQRFLLSVESRVSCLVLPEEVRQTVFDLSPYDEITIGRHDGCNIALKFSLVSGEHAVKKTLSESRSVRTKDAARKNRLCKIPPSLAPVRVRTGRYFHFGETCARLCAHAKTAAAGPRRRNAVFRPAERAAAGTAAQCVNRKVNRNTHARMAVTGLISLTLPVHSLMSVYEMKPAAIPYEME